MIHLNMLFPLIYYTLVCSRHCDPLAGHPKGRHSDALGHLNLLFHLLRVLFPFKSHIVTWKDRFAFKQAQFYSNAEKGTMLEKRG